VKEVFPPKLHILWTNPACRALLSCASPTPELLCKEGPSTFVDGAGQVRPSLPWLHLPYPRVYPPPPPSCPDSTGLMAVAKPYVDGIQADKLQFSISSTDPTCQPSRDPNHHPLSVKLVRCLTPTDACRSKEPETVPDQHPSPRPPTLLSSITSALSAHPETSIFRSPPSPLPSSYSPRRAPKERNRHQIDMPWKAPHLPFPALPKPIRDKLKDCFALLWLAAQRLLISASNPLCRSHSTSANLRGCHSNKKPQC
jgi:hypothetical protein